MNAKLAAAALIFSVRSLAQKCLLLGFHPQPSHHAQKLTPPNHGQLCPWIVWGRCPVFPVFWEDFLHLHCPHSLLPWTLMLGNMHYCPSRLPSGLCGCLCNLSSFRCVRFTLTVCSSHLLHLPSHSLVSKRLLTQRLIFSPIPPCSCLTEPRYIHISGIQT